MRGEPPSYHTCRCSDSSWKPLLIEPPNAPPTILPVMGPFIFGP